MKKYQQSRSASEQGRSFVFAMFHCKTRRSVAPDPLPQAVLVEVGQVVTQGHVVAVEPDDEVTLDDHPPFYGDIEAPVEVVATGVRTNTELARVMVIDD